jgi:hypothetical protein
LAPRIAREAAVLGLPARISARTVSGALDARSKVTAAKIAPLRHSVSPTDRRLGSRALALPLLEQLAAPSNGSRLNAHREAYGASDRRPASRNSRTLAPRSAFTNAHASRAERCFPLELLDPPAELLGCEPFNLQ